MAIQKNIKRTRTDTRGEVYQLVNSESPNGVDLTSWTNFAMKIDLMEFPSGTGTLLKTIVGVVLSPKTDGMVKFSPDGSLGAGSYFYNAVATDSNGETFTFAKGTYLVEENIG